MLKKGYIKVDDFGGGLVTKGSPLSIKQNQSPDCLNVISDIYKSLQKRLGYAKVNSGSAAGISNGIYNYRRTDVVQFIIGLWGSTLKKMDVVTNAWDGVWDTISVDANKGTALSDNFMHNTSFGTDCIITTEGRDVPQKYDPTDAAGYTDIDWETSHARVTGDAAWTGTFDGNDYLKVTLDGGTFDDIVLNADTTVAEVVASINAHSGFAAKGLAYADSDGYLNIMSNTRGALSTCVVAYGASDSNGTCIADLFDATVDITASTIVANFAPNGKHCTTWKSFVWIANTPAQPDRLYRSAASDITSWSATEYETIVTPGDIGITGFAILRGRLYVFKKHSIHRVTYLGGTPLLDIKEIFSETGTSSPRSIVNADLPEQGEAILFFGSDSQWYIFDGRTIKPISETISTYNGISNYCFIGDGSTYGLNPATLNDVHCVHYPRKHWCVLFFCLDNDTTPKDAIVYDYYSKSMWPMHFNDVFTASCISDNGNGQRLCYVAGTNYMWLYDTGNVDDTGNAINAYWSSMKLDLGSEIEFNDLRNITYTTSNSLSTPSVKYRTDWDSSWSDSDTLVVSTEVHTYDLPRQSDLFQFYISDNSTGADFEFIRASIVASKRGIAK